MSLLTIVMYHYVRDLSYSKYPSIKGLSIDKFNEQLLYIKKYYNVISADDLLGSIESAAELPPTSLLLTFDDGYIDHFTNVFPILQGHRLSGLFFPPAKCILESVVLDVNKIHFVLASVQDKRRVINDIYDYIKKYRSSYELKDSEYYWKLLTNDGHRFDSADVNFIRKMLQRELPESFRRV